MSAYENDDLGGLILVIEDVEETRDGIEKLLTADGYRVDPVRNEQEAVLNARRRRPDLILMSGGGFGTDGIGIVSRLRDHAELGQGVPAVIFCVDQIAEGAEVQIGKNIYATRPDNFEQLRGFLRRLLDQNR